MRFPRLAELVDEYQAAAADGTQARHAQLGWRGSASATATVSVLRRSSRRSQPSDRAWHTMLSVSSEATTMAAGAVAGIPHWWQVSSTSCLASRALVASQGSCTWRRWGWGAASRPLRASLTLW